MSISTKIMLFVSAEMKLEANRKETRNKVRKLERRNERERERRTYYFEFVSLLSPFFFFLLAC
jgi:hypothetical protein